MVPSIQPNTSHFESYSENLRERTSSLIMPTLENVIIIWGLQGIWGICTEIISCYYCRSRKKEAGRKRKYEEKPARVFPALKGVSR